MQDSANRKVVQIEPKRSGQGQPFAKVLDYCDRELIILLGDPGAGKTYCFQKMAAAEQAPIYSVQRFIARNGDDQARTVYLDGLDEYRPRTSSRDSNPAITLLQILRKSGNPRLRLSCRFADWLGSTDLELFKDYCGADGYAVLALEPLEPQEALQILADYGLAHPEVFLAEATARHMEWTVSNPQNLLMLADVVTHSGWPTTKRDLFEQWSLRHLEEHKESLKNSPLGHYAAVDLIDPAGASCAALLISDVVGIQLKSSDDQLPGYQSVPCANRETILAGLSRTAFSSIEPNVVTYAHRTIAEYLGARWLGKRVDEGLPLSRIQALLGVDSHPSLSLRGLHAWLPLFVPLQATALISKDPIGILTYGDAASLPPSQKKDLVTSLAAVAAENAWFLSESTSTYGLAGLSCSDTAEQLIAILRSTADPPSLKTLVLRAISVGEPLACFRPQLEHILADANAFSAHRQLAFSSLLRYGPDGAEAIVHAYVSVISREGESVALRSTIVGGLYGRPFGPLDVVALLNDAATKSESGIVGELWPLTQGIPGRDLIDVLEQFERQGVRRTAAADGSPKFEVSLCIDRMIGRICQDIPEDDADGVNRLLRVQIKIWDRNLASYSGCVHFKDILSKRPRLVRMLVESGVRHIHEFEHPPSIAYTLNRFTGGAVTIEAVAERLCAEFDGLADQSPLSPDMLQKYEALGRCSSSGLETANQFGVFMEIGKSHPECQPLLEAYTKCKIDQTRLQPSPYEEAVARYKIELGKQIASQDLVLRRGENLGLQGELAKLYFGLYSGNGKHARRKQLVWAIGSSSIKAVEQGFMAMVEMQPPPDLSTIAQASATNTIYWHWYAFLAGMDLVWGERHDISGLPKDTVAAAFALSLLLDTFDDNGNHFPGNAREWSKRILRDQPEIAEQVCTILLAEQVGRQKNAGSLLHRFPDRDAAPWRCKVALRLLRDYETTETSDLERLCLMAAESNDGRQQLAEIAEQRVLVPSSKRPMADCFWIVVGFALDDGQFETKLKEAAPRHPDILWIIRSLTKSPAQTDHPNVLFELSLHHIEIVVRTFGPIFPNVAYASSGWGDQSGADAAQYLAGLVSAMSTQPDSASGECLTRLLGCQDLMSYHPWISSRLTTQRELNRQSRYEKPTWKAVCAVVSGGAPANMEDLRALFLADLIDAAQDIRNSNVDKYRLYWLGGRYKLGKPQDEDFCRDRLVEYLRQRLRPLGVWLEPEGHMAADKRADMVVLGPGGLKLPVEVKRDTHPDLWVAAKGQLERLYTRDPNAQGYGVYLVFYFGTGRGRGITAHPLGVPVPDSSGELERMISESIPLEYRDRITCVVLDVSPPALARARVKNTKSKKAGIKQTKGATSEISSTGRKPLRSEASKKKETTVRKTGRQTKRR